MMNLQKILCLALAASVSGHALAMEIYNGRVLNEKSWSTDGKKVSLAKHKQSNMLQNNSGLEYQYTYAYINSASAKVGQPVTPNNISSVYVKNNTADNKTYRVVHSICVTIAEKIDRCAYHQQYLELSSDGYFKDDTVPELTLSFDKPGVYRMYTSTNIYDAATYSQPATGYAASDIVIS